MSPKSIKKSNTKVLKNKSALTKAIKAKTTPKHPPKEKPPSKTPTNSPEPKSDSSTSIYLVTVIESTPW
ncbi:hypothetical protein DSO57_1024838 [Entomophthora muscae]|uniref:Uncharacterized protein n=1 Tax=Entomophthora muscae TaxID=34485 RepID=A0ACC2UBZ3_9FUNG|nr:hypothetical protein DSO57_1024838 [Entomophthora muscae]